MTQHKIQLYTELEQKLPEIYRECEEAADEIGIPEEYRGEMGATGAVSGMPGLLRDDVAEYMHEMGREVVPNSELAYEIRILVKDVYGEEYDAVPVNTCEAALYLCHDVFNTPPFTGRGENYRSRYIAPYERHIHHQAGYGRPFPPKYKDLMADRGVTAGEFGFHGKRLENLDVVLVPLEGAKYDVHGIKNHPTPLLMDVDAEASIEAIEEHAERHASNLTGFASLGYDTPGYGYGDTDDDGNPLLSKKLGELAESYNVPYITDNAWGIPFVGTDPREINSTVMTFSMDKAAGAPTSGLIVGKQEEMVQIRRAMGMHGERAGTTKSYGKSAYVTLDPGKEALTGQIAALKALRDNPEVVTDPIDKTYDITVEEFDALPSELLEGIQITKSYNCGAVEVNYQHTWDEGRGIPIFSIEDFYSDAPFKTALKRMGVIPTILYDGNILLSPGLGTIDSSGDLHEEKMRYAVKAVVKVLEIFAKHAGVIEEPVAAD